MLWAGVFIIAIAFALFYRFTQAVQSDNEKIRSSAGLLLVSGVLNIFIGTNLMVYAVRTSHASVAVPSDVPQATMTMTDPKTGQQKTYALTPAEAQALQKNPSAVPSRIIFSPQ